jgi:hypothetical protein
VAQVTTDNETANAQLNEIFSKDDSLPQFTGGGKDFSSILDKARAKSKGEQFTLSPGQTRFGETGEQIATVAPKEEQLKPSDVFTNSDGVQGTFTDGVFTPLKTATGEDFVGQQEPDVAAKSELITDLDGNVGRVVDGKFKKITTDEGKTLKEQQDPAKQPQSPAALITNIASQIAQGIDPTPDQLASIDFLKQQEKKKPQTAKDVNDTTIKLRKDFDSHTIPKVYNKVAAQIGIIEEAYDEATNVNLDGKSRVASDQALVIAFNKMLDPESVVRESEFARTPEQVAALNRFTSIKEKVINGGLLMADSDRKAILDMGKRAASIHGGIFNNFIDEQSKFAEAIGVSKDVLFAGVKRYSGQAGKKQEPVISEEQAKLNRIAELKEKARQ